VAAQIEFTSSTVVRYLELKLIFTLINTVFQSRAFLVSQLQKNDIFFSTTLQIN